MKINGLSLIAGTAGAKNKSTFRAINPATGESLEPAFASATVLDVETAAQAAHIAFASYSVLSPRDRARFLRAIADGIDASSEQLTAQAHLETALPLARLLGEALRTSNQFRFFADIVEEGSWVGARIDTPLPDRKPSPRPGLRSMLRPIGPVAVFGASNFPLAFSVAGGDTASALAAGNPVVVKAHPAHPGTSELTGRIVEDSVRACALPAGVFSLLFDSGIGIGQALVQHRHIKAVGFTGSHSAGRALMNLAAQRPDPIPCFAEMGSTNPVFILPGALQERSAQLASNLHGSFTLGAGQMCTKPGLVFLPEHEQSGTFLNALRSLTAGTPAFTTLTPGIAVQYAKNLHERASDPRILTTTAPPTQGDCAAHAGLFEIGIDTYLNEPAFSEEVFGPGTLVIRYEQRDAMLRAAEALQGHLTATLLGTEEDLNEYRDLIHILEQKAGRLIINGLPTGVEVSYAMMHGGPYPSTSDSRYTSVGGQAILRFARPVCYQNFPHTMLPEELQDENSMGIFRMINGTLTRDPLSN